MNAITMTAMANFRKNKSRNILIGIAISLTAFLLTIVPTIGIGAASVEFAVTNNIYPTFHGMYRGINNQQAEEMEKDDRFKAVGLRGDIAYLDCDKADITLLYCDEPTLEMNKNRLKSGKMPVKADEVVLSEGSLKAMGINAKVGDRVTLPYYTDGVDGLSDRKERTFTITGMTEDAAETIKNKSYAGFVSRAFMEEEIPENLRNYRVYVQVADDGFMTKDKVESQMKLLADEYGLNESDLMSNKSYLYSNYVDTELYAGIAGIMAVIFLAGIITIYSIYYVSMIDKVQEYGKLRAMGATKKQIRRLVFREGFLVAGIASPIGVLAGALAGYGCIYLLLTGKGGEFDTRGHEYVTAVKEVVKNHEAAIIKPWILLLGLMIVLIAVYISLLKPMKAASRISPVEAIRFNGEEKKRKKDRKGYQELNVRKLTISNLSRNKKRTFVTILTLACTGIFFIAIATMVNCMDPEVMAREVMYGDFQISLDSSRGDELHPERERNRIQLNNPLTQEMEDTIIEIDGVKTLEKRYELSVNLHEVLEDGEKCMTEIAGVNEEALAEMKKYTIDGNFTEQDLMQEDRILLTNGWIYQFGEPKLRAGDEIHLDIQDGEEIVTKVFTIAAVVDPPRGLYGGTGFVMSEQMMKSMFHSDSTYAFTIYADTDKVPAVTESLQALADSNEFLELRTYQEELKTGKNSIILIGGACYALLVIFGLIGILNLVNTMINSVYARRRELGMLQAIGLSDRQLLKMLQMEGLYYTAGTVILSLIFGNLAGYAAFLYGKNNGMFAIKTYHYPMIPTVILIVVILTAQLLLTAILSKNLKKESLIDRIRFAD